MANIPNTYLYELPTLNLIQFFCHLLTELQSEQEIGLWHELGAGPGLITGVFQQHYQKRGWTFPCTSSDQYPSENITRQETVAEFTRKQLCHFKNNKTHIILLVGLHLHAK